MIDQTQVISAEWRGEKNTIINHKMSDSVGDDASPQHWVCQHQPHGHTPPVMSTGTHTNYTECSLLTEFISHKLNILRQSKNPCCLALIWHKWGRSWWGRSWWGRSAPPWVTDGAESSSRQCRNLETKIRCSEDSDLNSGRTLTDELATDLHVSFKICNITEQSRGFGPVN